MRRLVGEARQEMFLRKLSSVWQRENAAELSFRSASSGVVRGKSHPIPETTSTVLRGFPIQPRRAPVPHVFPSSMADANADAKASANAVVDADDVFRTDVGRSAQTGKVNESALQGATSSRWMREGLKLGLLGVSLESAWGSLCGTELETRLPGADVKFHQNMSEGISELQRPPSDSEVDTSNL